MIDMRNSDLAIRRLLGININKEFMPSVANTSGVDLSNYKVIKNGQFACNIMHVGRDEQIPIALYIEDTPAIISPAYLVFVVKNDRLLPEFLMMNFLRPELDRYAWFICDSSIRGGLAWDRFREIQIPIPDVDEQRKYVAIYKALKKNQQIYEQSLNDLQLICDSFLETLAKVEKRRYLGDYIRRSNERNGDLSIAFLRGISAVEKCFMVSRANMGGVDLSGYKIVRKGQFAFNPNTARMGDKIPIALNNGEPCIVSSIYPVFEIKDDVDLLPEFLLLWFKRAEFDRYVRFHSWGSARETFDWDDMCKVELPIPSIDVQKSIVAIHHVLETRKQLNQDLKTKIEQICPILIRGVVQ